MAYRVLIVEDDPMVAMINEQYVKQNKNFTVSTICRNGEEALNFLEGNKIDLIVLDVYMPVMDGVETLKRIRDKKISSEVIMVTAANDTNTLEQTMHLGVLDYLIKPFTLERFLVALEKFLSQKETLKQNSIIDQNCIDRLMTQIGTQDKKIKPTEYPKGINKKTLSSMIEYFNENPGWHSVEKKKKKLRISIVTVRHYMNYLVQQKSIVENINYETGGRPCMLYKKSDCQE